MPHIFGILRIRNEARWIERVIKSIQPICERVLVFDDHSTDGTPEICQGLGCEVHRSTFDGLDESRDKNFLLSRAFGYIPKEHKKGNSASPYWALAIDGDEELYPGDGRYIVNAASQTDGRHVFSLKVLYLWNAPHQIRVDGVYKSFCRPSLFRLMNDTFTYKRTPWGNGANFHCSNIPQEFLAYSIVIPARLLHYGYLHREDRLKKFAWYNKIDPNNAAEDCYRHMIQGDVDFVPAHWRRGKELRHAGPLQLVTIEEYA